jgi:hypothetical protein
MAMLGGFSHVAAHIRLRQEGTRGIFAIADDVAYNCMSSWGAVYHRPLLIMRMNEGKSMA